MNKHSWVVAAVVGLFSFSGLVQTAVAQSPIPDDVATTIAAAEEAVAEARDAIAKGKALLERIPDNSPYLADVTQMLKAASSNWKVAVQSLDGALESSKKIPTATSETLSKDYALLAKANANVALAGAQVVKIGLAYVEAAATGKTEALGLIREVMQDAVAASSQVQFNYERIKGLISDKYSN